MQDILTFFSHLLIITGGIMVTFLWLSVLFVGGIELYDTVKESLSKNSTDKEEDNVA